MKFQEVCEHLLQFEAVRGACSREWQITPALVMCTELDLSSYCGLTVSPVATLLPPESPSFLVITFFRLGADGQPWLAERAPLRPEEHVLVEQHRGVIRRWMQGTLRSLPASTSTRVADRFRKGRAD